MTAEHFELDVEDVGRQDFDDMEYAAYQGSGNLCKCEIKNVNIQVLFSLKSRHRTEEVEERWRHWIELASQTAPGVTLLVRTCFSVVNGQWYQSSLAGGPIFTSFISSLKNQYLL